MTRLYDYLSSLAQEVHAKPVRHVADHDIVAAPQDVPIHPAVRVGLAAGDAWLRVPKISKPIAPALPPYISWAEELENRDNPLRRPVLTTEHPGKAAFEDWVTRVWEPWAEKATPTARARNLYETLFRLRQRLRSDEATHELIWGHAVLGWKQDVHRICHPLLITRVRINFDEDSGELTVVPEGLPALELECLQGIGTPNMAELIKISEELRQEGLEIWSDGALHAVSRKLLAPLGLDAQLASGGDLPDTNRIPVITPTWRLFVRKRRVMFIQFFDRLKQMAVAGQQLPAPVVALAAGESEAQRVLQETAQDWSRVAERLLLPLAANEQQEQIARKLATHSGVTVQGPPGTGKSHTIANLIAHLVAHGKRVLVTAYKDQALAVLRDKIPAELRDLSLAVLGSSAADMTALQRSVNAITEAADLVDERREAALIASLQGKLQATETDVLQLRKRLTDSLAQEQAELTLTGQRRRAAELAEWLALHQTALGLIPDAIEVDTLSPLSPQEAGELFALARHIRAEDAIASTQSLPTPEKFPSGEELARRDQALADVGKELSDHERHITTWSAVDRLSESQLSAFIDEASQARDHLASLESDWLTQLRIQVSQSQQWRDLWARHAQSLQDDAAKCAQLRSTASGARVVMPEGYSPRETFELLGQVRQRFQEGKRISSLLQRRLAQFVKGLSIDGREPETVQDIDRTLAWIELQRVRESAAQLWMGEIVPAIGAPAVHSGLSALETWLEARAQEILNAIEWESQGWPGLRVKLRETLAPNLLPFRPTSADLNKVVDVLSGLRTRARQRALLAETEQLTATLTAGRQVPNASPLWTELATALAGGDWQRWDAALANAVRLRALCPEAVRLNELSQRVAAVAPQWAQLVRETGGDTDKCGDPSEIAEMWQWRQADTWLSQLLKANDTEEIQRRLALAQEELRKITLELTRRSAWLATKRNLGDTERQALVGWLQTLRRIGRGTTARANKWRAEAQRLMPQAMSAVPVWIMPYYRVAESFDPSGAPPFDVVIIDESSQCDVFALGLLGLGHKVVVVGDDKQISPSAVGINRARVDELVHAHLKDFPNALLLDMESSLYDASTRLFPGVVRLREHFRCLPSIIEFSSQLYYGGEIQPLREESSQPLPGPAVRAVYIPDGVRCSTNFGEINQIEADSIVNQIVGCCDDPAYADRTFGVISLLGSSRQAQYIDQRLLHKLGPEKYEKRQLRCGDSYSFQGDERDVIFVSVVADDNNRAAFTTKTYEQRLNVAASRAKDQMWVFHSVRPEQLHPDDQRAALIRYCSDQHLSRNIVESVEERCDSDFERRVLRTLVARGYRVTPQYPVGSLRIDLVVHGDGRKLAIECDGDKYHGPDQWESDLRRQTILERLGWRFWRVRGSAFYRNPEAAMASLWPLLAELGIEPGDDQNSRIVESVTSRSEHVAAPSPMAGDFGEVDEDPQPDVVLSSGSESLPVLEVVDSEEERRADGQPSKVQRQFADELDRTPAAQAVEGVIGARTDISVLEPNAGGSSCPKEPDDTAVKDAVPSGIPSPSQTLAHVDEEETQARPGESLPHLETSRNLSRAPEAGRDQSGLAPSLDDLFRALSRSNEVGTNDLPSEDSDLDPSEIRQWARANGYGVASRGRLPEHVVHAYLRAVSGQVRHTPLTKPKDHAGTDATLLAQAHDGFPVPRKHMIAAFSDEQLEQVVRWVIREGTEPIPRKIVQRILDELAPPRKTPVSDLQRIYAAVRTVQAPMEGTRSSVSKDQRPVRQSTDMSMKDSQTGTVAPDTRARRSRGGEDRDCLHELRDALSLLGVESELSIHEPVLIIRSPKHAVLRTGGRIEISLANLRFVWGEPPNQTTHLLKDAEGAAREIAQRAPLADAAGRVSTSQVRRPQIGNRPITDYCQEELVGLIQRLVGEGRAQTYDALLDDVLTELHLPGRTPRRVEIIEKAALQAAWKASHAEKQQLHDNDPHYLDVVRWARVHRYEFETDKEIPAHIVYHYNRAHPGHPYTPRSSR
ncbi:AAA domain-containing protein [Sphaerimonospora mesophila]|uniref:AAA domain-containing protein n=1 Tax=Sphaerimonospora mesophila TaxID=37483 RepID=UPI0006E4197F